MRKGLVVITYIIMTAGNLFAQSSQPDSSVHESNATIQISDFVAPPFPNIPRPLSLLIDTLFSPIGWINATLDKREIEVYIDREWKYITVTEYIDDGIYRIPFTAPVEWYFNQMIQKKRLLLFYEKVSLGSKEETAAQVRETKGIKIDIVDMGALGTASLRVRGNINISGKMVFQDQELIRSSLAESQNTHLEFDQKQNLNVEGKIGDRITVLMDNDSERDFDWENNIRISYEGKEDDIIQKVDAGNISLSLPATQYVTFSGQNKGLFGMKAISKLGPVDITTIASIEKTKKEQQKYKGTSEAQAIRIKDYEYIKNQYFFINTMYRNGTQNVATEYMGQSKSIEYIPPFYPLVNGLHRIGRYAIRDFELFRMDGSTDPTLQPGSAYVDIEQPSDDDRYNVTFKRLEEGADYSISRDLGFIRMSNRSDDQLIACHYIIVELSPDRKTIQDTVLAVGHGISEIDSLLALQMIKPQNLTPDNELWDLMFKNIYYMGAKNINQEGFDVQIWNTDFQPDKKFDPNGVNYITQFGLDSVNSNNEPQSDDFIDVFNPNIVSLVTGELVFPLFLPFASDSLAGGNQNPDLKGVLGDGLMYTSTQSNLINQDKHWEIEVTYTNKSSSINLGFMIVEGSEQVFSDGIELKRGKDYQIDYFSGTLILDSKIDPNAELEILFDKHELVSFDKKTIFGTRAQMDLDENSFIGLTALYYNQTIMNEKVEVGYEPMRNFIWDMNGRYQMNLEGLSKALDRLPLIETEKMSSFSIEGEIAQVMPNPNPINNSATDDPNGVAFIDDFEGSKRITSVPIQRRYWRESSSPIDLGSLDVLNFKNRAKLVWYNPYVQMRTKDIWPNQSTSIKAQNETTDILRLNYRPRDLQSGNHPDSVWAGIVTPLYSGDYDQTQTKFFEIWLYGDNGKLTVDLGRISEDLDGDGLLDTEDEKVAGMAGDGILDDNEDVGLDGCTDENEDGWGGCIDTLYTDVVDDPAWSEIVYQGNDKNLEDPNNDNWSYKEGSSDYSQINGTEGNALDVGRYPDSESLERSTELQRVNKYFTKSFYLSDTTYLAGQTKSSDGELTGWKLFRIPLNHFARIDSSMGTVWTEIRHLRLIVSDSVNVNLSVAKIELVGNDWQELGIAADSSNTFSKENADSIFSIAVINTEDNENYVPPHGVKGEYDRLNDIRSKEQSVVLKFDNLPTGYSGAAMKSLLKDSGVNYLTYDKMKLYVYGETPSVWIGKEESEVEFFLRFGKNNNYYEIRQPVYSGWDETRDRNAIEIDLEWLTALKLQDSSSVDKIRESDVFEIRVDEKNYAFTDENGLLTGKKIKIKGQPSLSSIQFFVMGVTNKANEPISGEIWADELRLSGVKKDKGMAMRLQSKFDLADLASTTMQFSSTDANFHKLQERIGSNKITSTFRLNSIFNLDKLLPKSMGYKIPVQTNYVQTENKPKYFPDSDILVNQSNIPDSIMSRQQEISLNTSITKTGKSDNKLIKATLDKIQPGFSASQSISSDVNNSEIVNEKYGGNVKYSYTFSRDNHVQPFKWLMDVPLVGKKLGEMNLYYSPSTFNASMDLNETYSQTIKRVGTVTENYSFGMNRKFSLDYNLTDKLKTGYSRAITSDLQDYRGYAWMAIRDWDPGVVENVTENLNTSFTPEIFNWLKPNFNHNAAYRWNKPRTSTIDGATIGTQLRFSGSVSILPSQIFEIFYKPPVKAPRTAGAKTRSRNTDKTTEEEKAIEEQNENTILTSMHGVLSKINPISFSYTENLNRTGRGVLGAVPAGYKFGWLPDHGQEQVAEVGSDLGSWDHSQEFTVRSGVNLTRNISTSFNFALDVTTTIGASNIEQRSMNRDYLFWGDKLESGMPMSGWSLRWSGLETWPIIKLFVRTASLEHSMSGKEARSWKFENFDGPPMPVFTLDQFIADYLDNQLSSRKNINFSPLVGLNMSLAKGISLNIRNNVSKTVQDESNGLSVRNEKSWTMSSNYSHRGGITIPLPMMDDWHIQNTVNFTLNFDMNENETLGSKDGGAEFGQTAFNSGWKTSLRISYSFSSQISGGIIYEYRESDSKTTGKKIDRDFGFDVNIAISG